MNKLMKQLSEGKMPDAASADAWHAMRRSVL